MPKELTEDLNSGIIWEIPEDLNSGIIWELPKKTIKSNLENNMLITSKIEFI